MGVGVNCQVSIDGTPFRRSYGILTLEELGQSIRNKGAKAAAHATSKYATQGDELAQIERGGNQIAEQAGTYFVEFGAQGNLHFKFATSPAISWHLDTKL